MKKLLLLVLVAACLLACLSVGAVAEETETGTSGGGSATTPGALVLKFFEKVASAFWRLLDYYRSVLSRIPRFARFMPIVVSCIVLIFCFFGYRLFRVETVLVGAVAGYAIAYAAYDFLLAWNGHPAFIETYENILRWVLVGVCAILGMFVGRLLRRIGVSIVLGLLTAAYFARYTSNAWVLLTVLAVVMLVGIVAIKPVVIFVTAVMGAVLVAKLLIGPNGFYPLDLNTRFSISPAVNVILILGVFLGLICAWIQTRTSRGRRYY